MPLVGLNNLAFELSLDRRKSEDLLRALLGDKAQRAKTLLE